MGYRSSYTNLSWKIYSYYEMIRSEVAMDPLQTGYYNQAPSYRANRETGLKCKYCPKTFDLPLYPQPIAVGLSGAAFEAQRKAIHDHEELHHTPVYVELEKHLTSVHKIKQCNHCTCYVVGGYLKKHQRSYDCKQQQRENILQKRGLVEFSIHEFLGHMDTMYKNVHVDLPWDDCEQREALKDELTNAKRLFRKLGEITPALSHYNKSPNDRGWQERDWMPEQVAYGLKMLMKAVPDPDQRNREAWQWLQMNDFDRESQLGGYELMAEYNAAK